MKHLLSGLALAVLATTAHADIKEDVERFLEGSYGGVSAGLISEITDDCPEGYATCHDRQTLGYKAWGGWRVSENLGMEVSYIHFGTFRSTSVAGALLAPTESRIRAQSIGLTIAPTWQVTEDFTAIGRIGVASVKTEYRTPTDDGGGWRGEPLVGAAVQWHVGRALPLAAGPLRGFSVEFGLDATRLRLEAGREWIYMFTVGGGLEF